MSNENNNQANGSTIELQPGHGCIAVIASSKENAESVIMEALNAHPLINCDWIDSIVIAS